MIMVCGFCLPRTPGSGQGERGYAGMAETGVVAGSCALTDWISLGVLASAVPRDAVDDAIAETGKGALRAGGKLPPHVMVYFVMALALFADDDYAEVAARLAGTLRGWQCWDQEWDPTPGAIIQARQRLGPEPVAEVFRQVAVPVAGLDTIGAFLGPWRLMSVDGMEWDVPDKRLAGAARRAEDRLCVARLTAARLTPRRRALSGGSGRRRMVTQAMHHRDQGTKLYRPCVSVATKRVPWAKTGWLNTRLPPTARVLRMAPVAALIR